MKIKTNQEKKVKRLFTPGPVQIPEIIQVALNKPLINHQTVEFSQLLMETEELLKDIFQTKNDIIMVPSSGTGAMEACITNFFSPGDEVIVLDMGEFSARWGLIAQMFGLEVHWLNAPVGIALDPAQLIKMLKSKPNVKGVLFVAAETSTGVQNPVKLLAELTKKHSNALVLVDAISTLAISELKTDDWGLDVVIASSQKGLMLPPGLSFLSVSHRAWVIALKTKMSRYYFDLIRLRESLKRGEVPYTFPSNLVLGCNVSCKFILEYTYKNWLTKYRHMTEIVHGFGQTLGLERLVKVGYSQGITVFKVPYKTTASKIKDMLEKEHDIIISTGIGMLKENVIRVAYIGDLTYIDLNHLFYSLSLVLKKLK